ncbi:MAG: nuclear transport factor 2 family protein [Deltaproteobacteria bacterium]|jgi:ketosteroid isomerase-like protein|nr:nuclear transport factor 2 family protein [Deltaproteobacteria bacterium]
MSKPRDAGLAQPIPSEPLEDLTTGSLTRELSRVEEANLSFYEAFSARDIERMSRIWSKSPHARCVHPGWELVVGWNDIRQSWVEIFRTVSEIDFQLEDVHVEVAGRTAWVNLIAYVHITTDDGEDFDAAVVTTNIYEQLEGQWVLVLHHSSNFADDDGEDEEEEEEFETSGQNTPGNNEAN